jgi:topoisomerase-4 subunit A
VVLNTGQLLIFPIKELPELNKGKGNKMINIPSKRFLQREEFVVDIAVVNANSTLLILSGSKKLKLNPKEWKSCIGERGQRGSKLPRAFQRVDGVMTEN